jgi:hypothetical protein
MERLGSSNGFFTDNKGNIVLLRGVNLAGSSKIPVKPDGTTILNQRESFYDHKNVSFIGRPFPESEAKEHYARLKKWGINLVRFLITWEAIEHKGAKEYDEEYIEYIFRMVKLAEKYGIYVFIDPHQDVWSRFTGGDGAPAWIFENFGMDFHKFKDSDLAYVHHYQGDAYKKMIWPQNYQKYPTATMFTLFFAGEIFAPNYDFNAQEFLQSHFINAVIQIAKKVSKCKNVIGFDSLNEPSPGFIGKENLKNFSGFGNGTIPTPTPFQEMLLSEGNSVNIDFKFMLGNFGFTVGKKIFNEDKISIWNKNHSCIWRKQNVWNYDSNGAPMLLQPEYFHKVRGKKIEFFNDFLKPFIRRYKTEIQKVQKSFFIFIESDPMKLELNWKEKNKTGHAGVVNATHWYDGVLLFTKKYFSWFGIHSFSFTPIFGNDSVQNLYVDCIKEIKQMSMNEMNGAPTVIGETGLPMDLEDKYAYKTNDYSKIEKILDSIYKAIEKNLVNISLWNYTPDNTHELGDRWNEEDLSIYSKDTPKEICIDGGRGTKAFSRPFPISTTGVPISISFDIEKSLFKYSFKKNENGIPSCVIFIPEVHYPNGIKVIINAGSYKYSKEKNLLHFQGEAGIDLYGITILNLD